MLHQHTLAVDGYKEDSKDPYFEFVNTGDWAYRDGRYYSNKSPGLSFLALVPFGVAEHFLSFVFFWGFAYTHRKKYLLFSIFIE